MKAVCWMGKSKVETLTVADPQLLNPHDAIIKITRTAICGSDLHLYDGFIPTMEAGDVLGHEFMGIVEEVGKDVSNLRRGDRVAEVRPPPRPRAGSAGDDGGSIRWNAWAESGPSQNAIAA